MRVFGIKAVKRELDLFANQKVCCRLVVDSMYWVYRVFSPFQIGNVLGPGALAGKILFAVWEACRREGDMSVGHDGLSIRMEDSVSRGDGIPVEENSRSRAVRCIWV